MSKPTHKEILTELLHFRGDYGVGDEFFDTVADYIEQVIDESYTPGPRIESRKMIRAEENKLLLDIYTILLPNSKGEAPSADMTSIALFDYLTKTYNISRK